MTQKANRWFVLTSFIVALAILTVKLVDLNDELRQLKQDHVPTIVALRDAVKKSEAQLATLSDAAPGLGEYMTTIQLHADQLWFAGKRPTGTSPGMNWTN